MNYRKYNPFESRDNQQKLKTPRKYRRNLSKGNNYRRNLSEGNNTNDNGDLELDKQNRQYAASVWFAVLLLVGILGFVVLDIINVVKIFV